MGFPGPHLPPQAQRWTHLLSELDDQRQLVVLDEIQQLLFGDLPIKVIPAFVKLWTERALSTEGGRATCAPASQPAPPS